MVSTEPVLAEQRRKSIALALGGGGARGLAHIGVLAVLEEAGIAVDCIVGSSMGGLVGALSAAGLRAHEIQELARGFAFPRWFMLGGVVAWDSVFEPALNVLAAATFEKLQLPLLLTATDLEAGAQIVLRRGAVLPSVRATCAVPGVMPAVNIEGRWLVDGGLVNLLPVDVAWMADPEVVIAVNPSSTTPRRVPSLDWAVTPFLIQLGKIVPNPATAKVCFEVLTRAAEIAVARQAQLATAMTGPELLLEPELTDIGIHDFGRLDEAVEAGRLSAQKALPTLRELLNVPSANRVFTKPSKDARFDPVCGMVISIARARATAPHGGIVYYFCSDNCRDVFQREPTRYLTAMLPPRTRQVGGQSS